MADELLVEGDVCDSCAPFWTRQGKEPMRVVSLNRNAHRGTPIVVCPYCDGSPILDRRLAPEQGDDEIPVDDQGLPKALPNKRLRPDGTMEPYEPESE